jgi:ribose transport system substrate-binding protein
VELNRKGVAVSVKSDVDEVVARELSRRGFLHAGAMGAVALGAGGLLSACGSDSKAGTATTAGGGAAEPVTFGFSAPYGEVPVVVIVKDKIKGFAQDEGWDVLLDDTQAGNLQHQLSTIDTWITQRVTAMNIALVEPSAYETAARRAEEAGIIWTTYAAKTRGGAGGVLFSPDLSGEVAGRAAVEWINANDPEAEVLVLEFPAGGDQRLRTDVPQRMIKEQTRAKIVAAQPAIDQAKGLQVTEDVLQAHPNVTVVIAHNDDGALGAADAFRKSGKQSVDRVWIVGQDGSQDALAALKRGNGYFKATAALDIAKVCQETVLVTKRAIDKGWRPGDPQEYVDLTPTFVNVGDTALIDRFLASYGA